MQETPKTKFSEVAEAIGDVCIRWAAIEDEMRRVAGLLAACIDIRFTGGEVFGTIELVLGTTDVRQCCSIVKLLAHQTINSNSPKLFERTEELVNYLDNVIRPERNRYIHDMWVNHGGNVTRRDLTPKIYRAQSREPKLKLWTDRAFENIGQIREFVKNLNLFYEDLSVLSGHLTWLAVVRERPPEYPQPLPEAWKSLAHRDWREPSRR